MSNSASNSASEANDSGLATPECCTEPIQFINSIQSYGYLVVLNIETLVILQVSANLPDVIHRPLDELIDQPVSKLFDAHSQSELIKALSRFPLTASPSPVSLTLQSADEPIAVYGYLHAADASHLVLELEPIQISTITDSMELYRLVQFAIAHLRSAHNLDVLYQLAAQEIRALTGCDRVKIYRFDDDWSGIVVGEARAADWSSSYKGMRFPAIDIPPMARRMFSLISLRMIVDINDVPLPLVPALEPDSDSPQSIDLSQSRLRSVADCHLQYLRNMSVESSFTLALVKEDQLWGLIACHHRRPKQIPHDVQAACDLLSQVIALELSIKAEAEDEVHHQQVNQLRSRLVDTVTRAEVLLDSLKQQETDLLELMDAHGAYLQINGKQHYFGSTPSATTVQRLIKWLDPQIENGIFYTHHLASCRPDMEKERALASGIFVISLSRFRADFLIWFRPEITAQVHWGGDPNRPLVEATIGYTLHPNFSFQLWQESVKGQSAHWKSYEIEAAIDLKNTILHQQLKHSQAETEVLIKEVHHRVKNNLQVVDSLLRQQARRATDVHIAEALNDCHNRVLSMALVHEHLYESSDLSRISISSYIRRLVSNLQDSYGFGTDSRSGQQKVELQIDHSLLKINSAIPCGLIISELVSNAMKYAFPPHETSSTSVVSIQFHCDKDISDQYWLIISDNGIGLPENVDFETTHSLGLKLVRGLVRQLRGEIKIDRALGTTYIVQFTDDV
ncbi:MAG: histidine kinase dimerization/phosphoacceptor domain -containing protein [Thainema sp.]